MTKFIELNKKKGGILVNTDAIKIVIPIHGGCLTFNTSSMIPDFEKGNSKIVLNCTEDVIIAEETYEEIKEMLKDEI